MRSRACASSARCCCSREPLNAVESIGDSGLTSALVTGQLLSSVALDRFGAFGLEKRDVTVARLAGVALLIAGTFLTVS